MNNQQIENQICTLYFYLNRGEDIKNEKLYVYIDNLLLYNKKCERKYHAYLHTLYKMLFQTRDCLFGKGERDISYVFLLCFLQIFSSTCYTRLVFILYLLWFLGRCEVFLSICQRFSIFIRKCEKWDNFRPSI